MSKQEHKYDCSFCLKEPQDVEFIFASKLANICNECIELGHKQVAYQRIKKGWVLK